jgi:hypothetical protein
MIECPACNSLSTIPIAYGKPSQAAERAAARGLLELGSCLMESSNPTRRCLDCKLAWQLPHEKDVASFLSDAVVVVQKHRDRLSNLISAYGAACFEHGETSAQGEGSRQGYQQMMAAYQEIDREWERFFIQAQSMCNRYAGKDAARIYGNF